MTKKHRDGKSHRPDPHVGPFSIGVQMRLGRRLYVARQATGLSQTDVAKMIGCSQAAISRCEAEGKPRDEVHRRAIVAVIQLLEKRAG